jgi:hypothetical protein
MTTLSTEEQGLEICNLLMLLWGFILEAVRAMHCHDAGTTTPT